MGRGNILGYDLNNKGCQISYYDELKEEPVTLEVAVDHYQIPLVLSCFRDKWIYGKEAARLKKINANSAVDGLYEKALHHEKVMIGGQLRDAVWLLAKYISLSLEKFENIDYITFSVPALNVDIANMLKGIGVRIGISKNNIKVQDYKESFCHYMFYQSKELWQYESALFYSDDKKISAYTLKKLKNPGIKTHDMMVTVDEVATANIEEMSALYPIIDPDKAKDADLQFKSFIENVFDRKVISSVYLTGDGFENNWYPNSLKVLCNGRRAFLGNNLYSKGACYTSIMKCMNYTHGPVYLDETKMTSKVSLKMRARGKDTWFPIVRWGTLWYECDNKWEVLLEDVSEVELRIETITDEEPRTEIISFEGMNQRKDYSMRLQIEVIFLTETEFKLIFKDIGFGEFYPASDFQVEKIISLGGNDGQLNSLS